MPNAYASYVAWFVSVTPTAEEISIEKSDIWRTHGKTFETWICSLVHALIGYCDDIILRYPRLLIRNAFTSLRVLAFLLYLMKKFYLFISRLCQDIVLQKAEVAELLFADVIVNLANRKNSDVDICELISLKVYFLMIEYYFCLNLFNGNYVTF